MHGLLFAYLLCTALTFCSSNYARAPALVDGVLAAADAATLDVASAGMFCAGFVAAYLHASMPPEDFARDAGSALLFGVRPPAAKLALRARFVLCPPALRVPAIWARKRRREPCRRHSAL